MSMKTLRHYKEDKVEDIRDLLECFEGEFNRREFEDCLTTLKLIHNKTTQIKYAIKEEIRGGNHE